MMNELNAIIKIVGMMIINAVAKTVNENAPAGVTLRWEKIIASLYFFSIFSGGFIPNPSQNLHKLS